MSETTKLTNQEAAVFQFRFARNLFANIPRPNRAYEFIAHFWSAVETIEEFYFKLIRYNIQADHGLYKRSDSMN